jgi:hypothetical protein
MITSRSCSVSDDQHEIQPVKGSLRGDKTTKPPHDPILRRDYPILARCQCGHVIRKTDRLGPWEHVPVDTLIAEWARHPSRTRRLTAEIAKDMVIGKPRHTSLGTGHEIAATYDVSHSMVSKARSFLADLGMVYKSGNFYFTGQPPAERM